MRGETLAACVLSSAATCLLLGAFNAAFSSSETASLLSMPMKMRPESGSMGVRGGSMSAKAWQNLMMVHPPAGTHAGWNKRSYGEEEPVKYMRYGCEPNRAVTITIDDGPNPTYTPLVLDSLKAHGIKATFFVVVANALAHPDIVKRMVTEGHTVGLHTHSHKNLTEVWETEGWDVLKAEVDDAAEALEKITGVPLSHFRPPYGAINEGLREYLWERGLTIVMWNAGCVDWYYKDATLETASIMHSMADAGAIVCMHDTQPSAQAEVELLISTFRGSVEEASPRSHHPVVSLEECLTGTGSDVGLPGNATANATAGEEVEGGEEVQEGDVLKVPKATPGPHGAVDLVNYPHGGSFGHDQ